MAIADDIALTAVMRRRVRNDPAHPLSIVRVEYRSCAARLLYGEWPAEHMTTIIDRDLGRFHAGVTGLFVEDQDALMVGPSFEHLRRPHRELGLLQARRVERLAALQHELDEFDDAGDKKVLWRICADLEIVYLEHADAKLWLRVELLRPSLRKLERQIDVLCAAAKPVTNILGRSPMKPDDLAVGQIAASWTELSALHTEVGAVLRRLKVITRPKNRPEAMTIRRWHGLREHYAKAFIAIRRLVPAERLKSDPRAETKMICRVVDSVFSLYLPDPIWDRRWLQACRAGKDLDHEFATVGESFTGEHVEKQISRQSIEGMLRNDPMKDFIMHSLGFERPAKAVTVERRAKRWKGR